MKPNPTIAHTAFLVGLTPLIPFPFLDEWVRNRLLRRSFRLVAASEGVTMRKAGLRWLAAERQGCMANCLFLAVWWPLKKIFKMVLYFLTIKECLDWMAEAAVRAELVRRACVAGALPDNPKLVRELMTEVMGEHDHSPVMKLIKRKAPKEGASVEGSVPERWVYRMVRAGGGAAICEAFSDRLQNRLAGPPATEE